MRPGRSSLIRRLSAARAMRAVACALMLAASAPLPARAQGAQAPPLDQAREMIKTGNYDGAIDVLRGTIDQSQGRHDTLRDAYLLLAKTYVIRYNEFRITAQGRETARLNLEQAREILTECLSTKELRHTRLEPVTEYPEEMVTLFSEVRGQIFGSFRVTQIEPPDAIVLLGTDTLRTLPGENLLGDVNLAVGPQRVVVHADGYKDLTEEVTISPNTTLERSYKLTKKRTATWYGLVGAGAAAVVAGIVALAGGKDDSPETLDPLPEAPPPPAGVKR